jgi:sulfate adenylyltransferase subunit 1 (EFTu-like GTPase family)
MNETLHQYYTETVPATIEELKAIIKDKDQPVELRVQAVESIQNTLRSLAGFLESGALAEIGERHLGKAVRNQEKLGSDIKRLLSED